MKRIKIIIFFVLTLFLVNCFEPEPTNCVEEYIIENISEHNVNLLVFYKDIENISNDSLFVIDNDKEIIFSYMNIITIIPFGLLVDSIYMDFDETLRIIYRKDDGKPRNILDLNSYAGGLVKGNYYKYQYFITDEDYDNAEEIK